MFIRRLLLLGILFFLTVAVLGAQTAYLTLGSAGALARRETEQILSVPFTIPTVRGSILDRHDRILAVDDAGWDIAVNYSVISGAWAFKQATTAARTANHNKWGEFDRTERGHQIKLHQKPYDEQVEQMWQTLARIGHVDREQIRRRQNTIAENIQKEASYLWSKWQEKAMNELEEYVPLAQVVQPTKAQVEAHWILSDVDDQTRLEVERLIRDTTKYQKNLPPDPRSIWSQVEIQRPKHRRYPLETITKLIDRSWLPKTLRNDESQEITVEGVAMHIVGLMGRTLREDEKQRPFDPRLDLGGYRAGDQIGKSGIERSMEYLLRGQRGRDIYRRDLRQRVRAVVPEPGLDVPLTIDIQLQARIQAIMTPDFGLMQVQPWHQSNAAKSGSIGQPLNGSAVVLDIENSEVLAAVSMPTMPLRLIHNNRDAIYRDPWNLPYLNRVVASRYPPGSTIKPILLISAVTSGVHDLYSPIECAGPLDPNLPTMNRCWYFKRFGQTHGPLYAPESIEVSCNIYYFTLGRKMRLPNLVNWYSKFGLGLATGSGLLEELAGNLPGPDRYTSSASLSASIQMGIGQGPIAWTPLQAAAAYAVLARGGIYLQPTFIRNPSVDNNRQPVDLQLDQAAVRKAFEGLHDVIHGDHGTGRVLDNEPIINIKGVQVYGKSGTADPGKTRWIDLDLDGRLDKGERIPVTDDHSWFIVLIQPEGRTRPSHVVAVLVEFGGSGAKVAGPIANQIIWALQEEGYLL